LRDSLCWVSLRWLARENSDAQKQEHDPDSVKLYPEPEGGVSQILDFHPSAAWVGDYPSLGWISGWMAKCRERPAKSPLEMHFKDDRGCHGRDCESHDVPQDSRKPDYIFHFLLQTIEFRFAVPSKPTLLKFKS